MGHIQALLGLLRIFWLSHNTSHSQSTAEQCNDGYTQHTILVFQPQKNLNYLESWFRSLSQIKDCIPARGKSLVHRKAQCENFDFLELHQCNLLQIHKKYGNWYFQTV